MAKAQRLPRMVKVDWIDSMGTSGWGALGEPSDLNCSSVGFLKERSKDRIVIYQNLSHNRGTGGDYMEIPACAIKRVRTLK